MSFKEYIDYQDSLLPGLATGFGPEIARKELICGALTGAVMVIGMKFGRTDPKDSVSEVKVYEKCRQFWDRFEKEFGNVNCYALTDVHFDNPEERQQWLVADGMKRCADILKKTTQMLCELIEGK